MSPIYTPVHDNDFEADQEPKGWQAGFKSRTRTSTKLWAIPTVLLLLTNIFTIAYLSSNNRKHSLLAEEEPIPPDYAKQDSIALDTTWNRFWWNTEYSPKNHNESDALWDAILPSHGFVAMDENWASERQWPRSMKLPSDGSQRVFLLEAYHQLHCLRIIQKTFWEAVEGRPFTWHPSMHMTHCFDTLRQSVQCNADSTPLYTFGDFTVGDGQLHKCRDWNQLRDFATEHSACYKDSVDPVLLKEHFGFCDDGRDGLP